VRSSQAFIIVRISLLQLEEYGLACPHSSRCSEFARIVLAGLQRFRFIKLNITVLVARRLKLTSREFSIAFNGFCVTKKGG